MNWDPPPSAQNFPVRPLTHGVDRGVPSQLVPPGGFRTLDDILVTERGLVRRPGFTRLSPADPMPYRPRELAMYRMADGDQAIAVLTEDTLYAYDVITGTAEAPWIADSGGSITITGLVASCAGATWATEDILALDLLRVPGYEAHIDGVASDTTLNLNDAGIPDGTYASYEIQRTIRSIEGYIPDWTVLDDRVIIADNKRALAKWEGAGNTLAYWTADTGKMPGGVPFRSRCVLAADDRIWAANTYDSIDGYQRQRIRWSALADPTDFSVATNFIDLPYLSGEILRLVQLGPYIIAYFTDGIYIGSLTNFPLLPRRFDRLETGGIGLVGSRAVTSWANTHFFVGQDDVYALGADGSLQPIGTRVIRDVLSRCEDLSLVYAVADPNNSQIVFGFPGDGDEMVEFWFFNLKTKGWSSGDFPTTMIVSSPIQKLLSWDALSGTWDALGATYPTWSSMGSREESRELVIASAGALWRADPNVISDFDSSAITVVLETGDIDFGAPDEIKVVTRLNVKIDRLAPTDQELTLTVQGSTDKGRRWKALGTIVIRPNMDEAAVVFRQTGAAQRFRLTSSSLVPSFAITEYGLRVRGAGSELSFGTQNG